jgi:hypothetical protein
MAIELLLALVVPALLAAIGMPLLGDWYDQHPARPARPAADPDLGWPWQSSLDS